MAEDESRFVELGEALMARLGDVAPLARVGTILDVGCAYARIPHALLRGGEFAGTYVGFDSLARQISWCRANLTEPSGDRFRFVHLDVRNERTNRSGKVAPAEIRFPVGDRWSELTVLTSVFTQLSPDAVSRYLSEVGRTLAPGGVAYATGFLIDPAFACGGGPLPVEDVLPFRRTGYCRYANEADPLRRIAYDQRWFEWTAEDAGLTVHGLQLGTWRRKSDGTGTQDTFLLMPLAADSPAGADPPAGTDTPASAEAEADAAPAAAG